MWAYLFIGTARMTGFTIFASTLFDMWASTYQRSCCSPYAPPPSGSSATGHSPLQHPDAGAGGPVGRAHPAAVRDRAVRPEVGDDRPKSSNGASFSGISLGVVTAIFSLVGFECATAFGEEAKKPLATIPRAVIVSLLLTGAFFVLVSYTEVLGLHRIQDHSRQDRRAAQHAGRDDERRMAEGADFSRRDDQLLFAGAVLPEFRRAHSLSDGQAGRVSQLDRHFARNQRNAARRRNHNGDADLLVSAVMVTVFRLEILDAFNDAGTFGAFGFLRRLLSDLDRGARYLKQTQGTQPRRSWPFLRRRSLLLLVPAVGSVYPVPPWPVNIFPYIFLGYLAIGLAWFMILRRRPDFTEAQGIASARARSRSGCGNHAAPASRRRSACWRNPAHKRGDPQS